MKKLMLSVIILIISALGFVCADASEPLPMIFIDDVAVTTDDSFFMKNGTIYVEPYTLADLFSAELTVDTNSTVYTFSTKLRNATYDSSTGSLNITDKNSFNYEVYEKTYLPYTFYEGKYFPIRMICTSLGLDVSYSAEDNSVKIKTIKDCVGLFNSQGTAIATRGDKYGLVNRNGDILLSFAYDAISNYDNPEVYKLSAHHRCGLADTHGNLLTEIVYNDIRYENPGAIYLRKERNWGMCDITGTIIIPVIYEDVTYCANMIAMVKSASKWYVLNCRTGQLSHNHYDEVYKLTAGVQTDNKMINGYYVKRGEKWGYIDSFGEIVIDIKYEALDKFDEKGRARFILNNRFGVIDCGGKVLIPAAYDYLDMFGNLSVTVAQVGNNYGIINDKFEVVAPFEYDYIYSFNDQPSTVAYKDNYFGIISANGHLVSDFKYTYMENFKGGMALAFDDAYGYVDHNGNEIIDTIHSDVKQGTALSVFLKHDNKWALYSPSGQNLTGFIYTNVGSFSNGLSAVSQKTLQGEKYGYVNDSGDVIIPCQYDSALDFKYGRAIVKMDRYSGIIDVEGETIIPFEYTGFNPSYDYNIIAAADNDGKWGLISFKNEKLTEFKYDFIFEFDDGVACILKDHKFGVIDVNGVELVEPKYKNKETALGKLS